MVSSRGILVNNESTSRLPMKSLLSWCTISSAKAKESDDTSSTAIRSSNFWSDAPDEIVEIILLYALQQSKNSIEKCETYNSIKSICQKCSKIVERKGPAFLVRVYIDTWQPIGKSCNGNILVSTRKLTSAFGKLSGLASQLSNCIGGKKWKSS